ncbi:MAG: hypothetical protein GY789_16950 [Hyphomicrobiales bacterium]|nr:hypothetical protein [Hyphomicrobiales bacterium]MCP5001052.1 hypothetical protein [Hyphomicrobiales bacterium]
MAVASPELPGNVKIDNYLLELSTNVPPIPTHVVLSTEGLEFPVALLDDKEAEMMLKAAGIDVLRLTEKVTVDWDEATEDLIIDRFVFELGKVGRVRAKARLGDLPKSVLLNPQQAQAAIATLNVKSLEIELENDGGVEAVLALSATDAGVSEGMMKEALLMQLDGLLAQIGNEAFTNQMMTAARVFFDDPKNLKLSVAPGNPVPVSQLISDAMIAPDALPERLGVTVEANR